MQVSADCLGSARQGLAANRRFIFTELPIGYQGRLFRKLMPITVIPTQMTESDVIIRWISFFPATRYIFECL